ncbi:MAG: AAA family ATPase, partial [Gemmatimonadetes bacterium]|nr:AAA family ATPase [Gemmatimonadota bacterium]
MGHYIHRVLDDELDELLGSLAAVSLEGPRGVGKTETALRRANTVHRLDDPAQRAVAQADPARLVEGTPPILIDEWQRVPESWDVVRRAVDDNATPAQYLLTGSATPTESPTHSGAGRIVTVRMRPMTLAERGVDSPTVSLRDLLGGDRPRVQGQTEVALADYTGELVGSGFPGLRSLRGRPLRAQLESYLSRIVDVDFEDLGRSVRKPQTLRRWMSAYAAATAT